MVKPLTFKGDKPKSKKRKQQPSDLDPSTASSKHPKVKSASTAIPDPVQDQDETLTTSQSRDQPSTETTDATASPQSWVSADVPSDISGPILIVLPSDPPTCIASDMNGKVFASELENLVEGDPRTAEPHDVRQVWVATRVAGTEKFSLKGGHGRFVIPFPVSVHFHSL